MPDHGFEAGVEAVAWIINRTRAEHIPMNEDDRDEAREALRASDQARLGDRQELVEAVGRALNLEAGRQRGLAFEDDWETLTEQERGGWRLCAQAALNAVADHLGMEGLRGE